MPSDSALAHRLKKAHDGNQLSHLNGIFVEPRHNIEGLHALTKHQSLIFSVFFVLAALGGEHANGQDQAKAAPLVFIHGIKGARLVTADGNVGWATFWQGMGFSTPDLALAPRFENGVQPAGEYRPDGVLATVTIVPALVENSVYGPWLEAAATLGHPFVPFAYDWRRDNNETVTAFIAFLTDVKHQHGGQSVHVVAHSMGGLITLVALNERPDLFASVTFAGVPFQGGIGFLPDLHVGIATGLNDDILSPQVLATFPSVYTLFPSTPGAFLIDKQGLPLATDFFAATDWCRLKIGACVSGKLAGAMQEFFPEALALARRFRERMVPREGVHYPPVLVVASQSRPTLSQAMQAGPASYLGWDFTSLPAVPGDERVAFADAMPPERVPYKRFVTANAHAGLLNDPKVIQAIKAFVNQ